MRTMVLGVVAAISFFGCDEDTGNGVVAVTLNATLTGAEETPAVSTTATGTSTAVVNAERTQIVVTVNFSGLTTGTTLAHIHKGAVGVAGPIIFDINVTAGFTSPQNVTLTEASLKPNQGTFAENINALLTGGTYVNVHSTMYPMGEIRGQLR